MRKKRVTYHRTRPAGEQGPVAERERDNKLLRIAGLPAVLALFGNEPERIERLFLLDSLKREAGPICAYLASDRRPYRIVEADELEKIAGTAMHGGIVALAEAVEMPYFEPEDGLEWAAAGEPLLILDGVGNPHNLGAIVRSAAFFGLKRILVSDNPEQALPSDASHRVARGGMAHVEIIDAGRIEETLQQLKPHYLVIATGLGQGQPWRAIGPGDRRPRAIVLGNEEAGLDPETLAACDVVLTIPGSGKVQSLNVAATAAILIHLLADGK